MPSALVSPASNQRWLDLMSKNIGKLPLVFPDRINRPSVGYIPYEFSDHELIRKIDRCFIDDLSWQEITLDDLKDIFEDEHWSFPHFLGWDGLTSLTPLFLKLGYEAYIEGDEFCRTVEHIFAKLPREADDKTKTLSEWMASFDALQILSILDLMTFIRLDPLRRYPDGFNEGYLEWTECYLRQV